MISALLLALALSAQPDMEKFDCKAQCKQMQDMCAVGCVQEGKEAKRNGEKPPDCKALCDPAVKRCEDMCKQFDTAKAKGGSKAKAGGGGIE